MCDLGIRYGKGLQLVNILRDVGKDLRSGRCYLPKDELGEEGPTERTILEVSAKWRKLCMEHLECGMQYVEGVRNYRARLATVLPLLLAVRTMALVKNATWDEMQRGVKIPRKEVKRTLAATLFRNFSSSALRRAYEAYL